MSGELLGEAFEQPSRHRRSEQCVAARDDTNRLDQVGRPNVLQQETARPCAQRSEHVLVRVERGEDDDPSRVARGDDAARRLDPVHAGHPHVHQDDVGPVQLRQCGCLGAVLGLPHHLEILLRVHDHPEAAAHQRLVVRQQDADAHSTASSGRRA